MEEDIALIQFINAREPGNILRDIAERRLCDLKRQEWRVFPETVKRRVHNVRICKSKDGHTFDSMKNAALYYGINYSTMKRDINIGQYKFGVVPVNI